MSIKVICRCGKELNEPGAILWSPPDKEGKCVKTHICKECYEKEML